MIFWMLGIFHFVCAILGFVCKVLEKKRQSFENVCKQVKKTVKVSEFIERREGVHKTMSKN